MRKNSGSYSSRSWRREATREDAIDPQSADEPPKQPEKGIGGGALVAENQLMRFDPLTLGPYQASFSRLWS
ncbi:MAG: hypothetical protein WB696_06515 [Chthoniobacterales bacterium]|jgi:hypothetical protein